MSLFTGKGDNGTTGLFSKKNTQDKKSNSFNCDQKRISKSSSVAEALGALDEINSFLGLCKIKSCEAKSFLLPKKFEVVDVAVDVLVHEIQKNLFIVQAEIAGAPKTIEGLKVKEMEDRINWIENVMPPIKTFFISGGVELASLFDVSRTIARRAERRVVKAREEKVIEISDFTGAYLNRLSSMLYALARFTNHLFGKNEDAPDYK